MTMGPNPFVVGQWVRGERFYGRRRLIREIFQGERSFLWVLGTRRIGKTSLLKELERQADAQGSFLPLFWDLQGATTADEMHELFGEAVLDAAERLQRLGMDAEKLQGRDLFGTLRILLGELRSRGMGILLLCDEVEELIGISQSSPAFLGKLRRAMQSKEDVRTVLSSTVRLWELVHQTGDTSPFLHGCTPPLYLSALDADASLALIRQDQLPEEQRPSLDMAGAQDIRQECGDHPYLLQLICKRAVELGDIRESIARVALDPMVQHFFAIDFEMLEPSDQEALFALLEEGNWTASALSQNLGLPQETATAGLLQMEQLGWIRRLPDNTVRLRNSLFRRWLEARRAALPPRDQLAARDAALGPHLGAILADAVDRLALGVIFVDDDCRVHMTNRSARLTLDEEDGLLVWRGALQTTFPAESAALRSVIVSVARGESDSRPKGLLLHRLSRRRPLTATVLPLLREIESGPSAVVFITDPERRISKMDHLLKSVYGLTEAESRSAAVLLQGLTVDETASNLGITANTVRTHLRRIYAKTNTHRQGELIKLLLAGPLGFLAH